MKGGLRGGKRGEIIDTLLAAAADKPYPASITKLKPVRLWRWPAFTCEVNRYWK